MNHPTNSTERQVNPVEQFTGHIMELAKTKVRDSAEYRELMGRGMSHPDAFRKVAHKVAENPKSELSQADRALLHITGELGVFVQAQSEAHTIQDGAEGRRYDDDEKQVLRELKDEYLIPFNHHLKDFINTHPNDDIRTVSSALTSSYGTIFSRHECIDADKLIYNQKAAPKEIFLNVQGSIDGMRHEIAAETLLDAAGYSYDYNVSAKEDSMGNDLYVYLESGWEPIDVKASVNAVQKSRLHNRRSKAVWTGLDWGDFTGSKGTGHGCLSIPYPSTDAQLNKADAFVHEIRTMVATNRQQANRVGAASLRR